MDRQIRVLIVEDSVDDAELLIMELENAGYRPAFERVETEGEMREAIETKEWDLIIADYTLPNFNALSALALLKTTKLEIPFIVVSGTINEETAVEAMRLGASDYILKGNITRLIPAIDRELKDAIAHQHANEERMRLQTAIEQSADAVIITDSDAGILYVNPAFEQLTGYTREEAIGKNPKILQSGRHGKKFYEKLWKTIEAGQVWSGTFINKKKDGTIYEEEATISPMLNPKKKITNYVAVKHDVTEENSLRKAKDYFTSITAHELNTPLTKLQLSRELINSFTKENFDPQTLEQIKSSINESFFDLSRIVSTTLLISELSLSKSKDHFENIWLRNVISNSIDKCKDVISDRKIKFNVSLDPLPSDSKVLGNEEICTRAFDELLSNAVKFSPDGKTIDVTASIKNGQAVITIRDFGIGIPVEQAEQVYEPYFSLESVLEHSTGQYKFKGGGIGIGLTLSRTIIEHHRGKLSIESEGEEKGTLVTVKLPLIIT